MELPKVMITVLLKSFYNLNRLQHEEIIYVDTIIVMSFFNYIFLKLIFAHSLNASMRRGGRCQTRQHTCIQLRSLGVRI